MSKAGLYTGQPSGAITVPLSHGHIAVTEVHNGHRLDMRTEVALYRRPWANRPRVGEAAPGSHESGAKLLATMQQALSAQAEGEASKQQARLVESMLQ